MSNTTNNIYPNYLPNKVSTTHLLFNVNDTGSGSLNDVLNQIYNPTFWETITIGDVTSAIVSLKAYPFIVDVVGSSETSINMLGKKVMDGAKAKPIESLIKVFADSFTVGTENLNFTDYPPYCSYFLFLPFAGFVEMQAADIIGQEIHIEACLDLTSGDIIYYIYNTNRDIMVATKSVNVSVDIPTQSQNKNINNLAWLKTISNYLESFSKAINSAGTAAVQAVTGNPSKAMQTAVGGMNTMTGAMFDYMWGMYDATRPNLTGSEAQGNLGWFGPTSIYLIKIKNKLSDTLENTAKAFGRALLKFMDDTSRKSLQGRTKYRQCHIASEDMTIAEMNRLNEILTSGFTIE